jgi:hypothetical protein
MEKDSGQELGKALEASNPWRRGGSALPEDGERLKRDAFRKARKALEGKSPVILLGMHGTGKTTLVKQLIGELLLQGIPGERILHVDFASPSIKIHAFGKVLEEVKKRAKASSGPFYFFLDNPHYALEWGKHREALLGIPNPWKLFISAPSSAVLEKWARKKEHEQLARIFMPPLSFREFLALRGASIEKPGLSETLEAIREFTFAGGREAEKTVLREAGPQEKLPGMNSLLDEYIRRGGFPTLAGIEDGRTRRAIFRGEAVEPCVYRDMVILHEVREVQELEKALLHFAARTSEVVNMQHLAHAVGVSRPTLMLFFSYFKDAFLAAETRAYSLNPEAVERSMLKTYILDSSLRAELLELADDAFGRPGEMLASIRTALFSHLHHVSPAPDMEIFYWRDPASGEEIDFVLSLDDSLVPVKVEEENKDPEKTFLAFFEAFTYSDRGILLTRKESTALRDFPITLFKRYRVLTLPVWKFLCSFGSAG